MQYLLAFCTQKWVMTWEVSYYFFCSKWCFSFGNLIFYVQRNFYSNSNYLIDIGTRFHSISKHLNFNIKLFMNLREDLETRGFLNQFTDEKLFDLYTK